MVFRLPPISLPIIPTSSTTSIPPRYRTPAPPLRSAGATDIASNPCPRCTTSLLAPSIPVSNSLNSRLFSRLLAAFALGSSLPPRFRRLALLLLLLLLLLILSLILLLL